jgi:hypothetical protein
MKNKIKRSYKYHCKTCDNKLQKRGKTAAGIQRWKCIECSSSKTNSRPDLSHSFTLSRFVSWLLGKLSQDELEVAARTFRDQISWCWDIVPRPVLTGEIHEVIIIDGIRVAGMTCLIARTPVYVLNWVWVPYESSEYWLMLLTTLPTPKHVVCNGQNGMLKAISICWSSSIIQRCRFHVWLNIKAKLTLNPESVAAKALLQVGRDLLQVKSKKDANNWKLALGSWYESYQDYVNQRTVKIDPLPGKRKWHYTHARLRSAYKQLIKVTDDVMVFAYHSDPNFPATTNCLEGGINSPVRTQIKLHRGMSHEHQKRLVEWYLYTRTEGAKPPRKCL